MEMIDEFLTRETKRLREGYGDYTTPAEAEETLWTIIDKVNGLPVLSRKGKAEIFDMFIDMMRIGQHNPKKVNDFVHTLTGCQ